MFLGIIQLFVSATSWVLLKIFTKFHIEGRQNLRELEKPFIVVSNHESHLDPQLIGVMFLWRPKLFPLRYMAKDRLFWVPGLNILIFLLGAFRAHKKKGIHHSLRAPSKILKNGGGVIMFPEGRMITARPKLGQGRRGAAMLALMTGAAILPVSLHTPHDLPPIPIMLKRHRVKISIGEPFYLNNLDYPDLSDENTYKATSVIMQKIADLYYRHEY